MTFIQRAWGSIRTLGVRCASRAATVRAVAGAPLGTHPPLERAGSRRGTVLVIVLGTLALIAVIAVVYAVVGQADRRASAAFVGSVRREEMPALLRDYIADIVGRDAIATYRDGAGTLKRESFDYPFTDPYLRSVTGGPSGVPGDPQVAANERIARTFNPEGTFFTDNLAPGLSIANVAARGSVGNVIELRVPSDPWLAATQATNLRTDDDVPDGGYRQYNMRDWAHISNVSADGRFVNLWNLRNNFGAASGFDDGQKDISSRLTLNDPTGLPQNPTSTQVRDDGTDANLNSPADWTYRQRGAFRPAASSLPGIGWSDARNPLYQWADADGDGFLDARWFEFMDISEGLDVPRPLFPRDPEYRWFGAVRIVDLSGAVNVNTATEFLAGPQDSLPNRAAPGGTPADIDLRRLLTGEDVRELASSITSPAFPGVGYEGMRQPRVGTSNTVDTESAQFTGLASDVGNSGNYSNTPLSEVVGDAAYNHIRYFLEWGLIAPPGTTRLDGANNQAFTNYVNQQHGVATSSPGLLRYATIDSRREWYDIALGLDPADPGEPGDLSVSVFTIDSEAELLTFRGANDPSATSTLELVADGRFDNGNGANPATGSHEYGPLRSSRGAQVELAERDRSTGLIAPPGTLAAANPDGVADLDAMTHVLTDLRQYITSLSASRPLRNTVLSIVGGKPQLALSASDQPLLVTSIAGAPRSLFSLYANALLPFSDIAETWLPLTDPDGEQFRTLSYGHEGSEVAIWHAAHAAVNMADAVDSDSNPTIATVIVDESMRDDLNADYDPAPPPGQNPTGPVATVPMAGRQNQWAAWVDGGNFDLGRTRIADSNGGVATPTHPAFNVYGFEPQPFLTEVAAVILYTDAPAPLGDDENDNTPVTIQGARDGGNGDIAFQAIAFQVTNPFDTSITLGGASSNGDPLANFYIEFGGRFYRIPDTDTYAAGWSGSLGPRETRVFYAPARPMSEFETRWESIAAGGGAELTNFLNGTLGVASPMMGGGNGGGPVQLVEFNPVTGADEPFSAADYIDRFDLLATNPNSPNATLGEARLWRMVLASGQTSSNQPAEESTANSLANDILADRLRDPNSAAGDPSVLDPELNLTPNNEVANALKNPPVGTNYDTGLTAILWGTIRRPSDPEAQGISASEIVWLPAYCTEPKFNGAGWNSSDEDGVDRDGLTADSFDINPEPELGRSFLAAVASYGGGDILSTLIQYPSDKTHDDVGSNTQGQSWSVLAQQTEMHVRLTQSAGGREARALRPADMLMARGIGASLAVDASMNPAADFSSWTTVGEAQLLALDYDQGTQGVHVLWRPSRPAAGTGLLDRGALALGHLQFDQFVPFYDENADGAEFDPTEDTVYGDGMPLALGVIGQLRSLGDQYGTFRRGTPGLININTAPLAVLRTLPMLSPTHATDPNNPGSGPGSAWNAFNGSNTTGQQRTSDVASMLLAARDLLFLYPRGDEAYFPPTPPDDEIDFTVGRRTATGIAGIRPTPGFRSIAEVFTVREIDPLNPQNRGLHDIDRLGFDGQRVTLAGFDPHVYLNSPVDPLTDEFDERLILANAIAPTITVRSDVYACWFVLHGYRETDCTGLSDSPSEADPLIPSVSRRFLMILDRSRVIAPGDKPAVLLFREVPYSPTTAGDGSAI